MKYLYQLLYHGFSLHYDLRRFDSELEAKKHGQQIARNTGVACRVSVDSVFYWPDVVPSVIAVCDPQNEIASVESTEINWLQFGF